MTGMQSRCFLITVLHLCCLSESPVQFQEHYSISMVTIDYCRLWEISFHNLYQVPSWFKLVTATFLNIWKFLLITVTYLCLEHSFPQVKKTAGPDDYGSVRTWILPQRGHLHSSETVYSLWLCRESRRSTNTLEKKFLMFLKVMQQFQIFLISVHGNMALKHCLQYKEGN